MAMRCFFPEVPAPAVRGENPLTTARVDVNCDRGWRVEFRQQNRPISKNYFVQDAFPCTFNQGIDKRRDRMIFCFGVALNLPQPATPIGLPALIPVWTSPA